MMVWTGTTIPRARGNRLAGYHIGVRAVQSVLVRIEARDGVVPSDVAHCATETDLNDDESWYYSLRKSQIQ